MAASTVKGTLKRYDNVGTSKDYDDTASEQKQASTAASYINIPRKSTEYEEPIPQQAKYYVDIEDPKVEVVQVVPSDAIRQFVTRRWTMLSIITAVTVCIALLFAIVAVILASKRQNNIQLTVKDQEVEQQVVAFI